MNIRSPRLSRRLPGVFSIGFLCASWLMSDLLASGNGTWLNTGSSSNWSATDNWVGGTVAGSTVSNNSDVAIFNTSVGTVGTSGNPILIDTASWALKGITFDTANVGSFVIGTAGGNGINLTSTGAITMTSGTTHSQTINAPLAIQATNGKYSFVNNATESSATLNIGGPITAGATSGTTTLTLDGSNTGNNTVSGAIGGGAGATVALTKSGPGTWVLTGANTYTGATILQGGNLVLDYTASGAPASNIISASSPLALGTSSTAGNQTLTINGKAGAGTTQTFGNTTFNGTSFGGGASHIILNAGVGGTLALALGTLPAKCAGATLDFTLSAGSSVTVGTASAATGTGSGLFANAITVNGSDFATNQGISANALVGLSTVSGAYDISTTFSSSLTKALDVQGDTSITGTGTATIPAIRFNQAAANTIMIASDKIAQVSGNGAILVTANVGANVTTITGGTLTGVSSRDLSLIQNNTLGRLQIDSVIGGTALTKSGQGLAVLAGANTYTGKTLLNEGTLQFAKQVSLYNNTTASWTAANINVASGATLALNVGGSGEFTTSDVATISALGTATGGLLNGSKLGLDTTNAAGGNFSYGTAIANTNGGANMIGLRKLGANTLTLTGANTYTGGTSIEQGQLALTQSFSMGSTSANAISITNATSSTPTAGTDYGQLIFSGTTLTYGGSLTLSLTGMIGAAATYDLIDFTSGTGSGNFNSVSIAGSYVATLTSSGTTWTGSSNGVDFFFDTTTGDLTVSPASVPEPSTLALILGALALVGTTITRRAITTDCPRRMRTPPLAVF